MTRAHIAKISKARHKEKRTTNKASSKFASKLSNQYQLYVYSIVYSNFIRFSTQHTHTHTQKQPKLHHVKTITFHSPLFGIFNNNRGHTRSYQNTTQAKKRIHKMTKTKQTKLNNKQKQKTYTTEHVPN